MPSTGHGQRGFSVRAGYDSGACVLDVRGELEISTVDSLQPAIEGALAASGPVVIDLCGTSFLDSQGLYALLVLRERLREQDRELAIACWPDGAVALLFQVSGTDRLFELRPSREAAIAAVIPAPEPRGSLAADGLRWYADRVLAPAVRVTFGALRSLLR
jgi:anti-anti-sigma factor